VEDENCSLVTAFTAKTADCPLSPKSCEMLRGREWQAFRKYLLEATSSTLPQIAITQESLALFWAARKVGTEYTWAFKSSALQSNNQTCER
jgi:hypothetical protein